MARTVATPSAAATCRPRRQLIIGSATGPPCTTTFASWPPKVPSSALCSEAAAEFPAGGAIDGMQLVDWSGIYSKDNWLLFCSDLIWSDHWMGEARLYISLIWGRWLWGWVGSCNHFYFYFY
jgi:hypothetical protein